MTQAVPSKRRWLARLRNARVMSDTAGVTTTEFVFVAPVFLMLVMGCLDIGHTTYAIGVLDGAVEKAARDSSLETANTTAADNIVKGLVGRVLPDAVVTSTRKSYFDFTDVDRPEKWDDANNDGTCSTGEQYVDKNNNGRWDEKMGADGNGGANDVVMYTVTVRYDAVFKLPLVPLNWNTREISSTAVRRNQPFALQASRGSGTGTC